MTVTPTPFVRHVILGASVTRLAVSTAVTNDSLRYHVPYIVVDGLDDASHGGTAYGIDGRGLTVDSSTGGPNLWAGFLSEISRGILRPDDWLIMNWTLGTEALTLAEPVIADIVDRCIADGYRLCWTYPRVAYGEMTEAQQEWNDGARALIDLYAPTVPIYSLVDWPRIVESWTIVSPTLPQADKDIAQPLLYDGRHPTGISTHPGRGCERFATAVAAAVGY